MPYSIGYGNPYASGGVTDAMFKLGADQETFARRVENNKLVLQRRQLDLEATRLAMQERQYQDTSVRRDTELRRQHLDNTRQEQQQLAMNGFRMDSRSPLRRNEVEVRDAYGRRWVGVPPGVRQELLRSQQWQDEFGLRRRTAALGEAREVRQERRLDIQDQRSALGEENTLRQQGFALKAEGKIPGVTDVEYTDRRGRVWVGPSAANMRMIEENNKMLAAGARRLAASEQPGDGELLQVNPATGDRMAIPAGKKFDQRYSEPQKQTFKAIEDEVSSLGTRMDAKSKIYDKKHEALNVAQEEMRLARSDRQKTAAQARIDTLRKELEGMGMEAMDAQVNSLQVYKNSAITTPELLEVLPFNAYRAIDFGALSAEQKTKLDTILKNPSWFATAKQLPAFLQSLPRRKGF